MRLRVWLRYFVVLFVCKYLDTNTKIHVLEREINHKNILRGGDC
jgi:hypothetical protein